MKVIFITREGYRLPGARVRCYNFAQELSKYDIETKIISYADTFGAKDGERERELKISDKIRLNYRCLQVLAEEKDSILYLQRFNYHSLAPYLMHLLIGRRVIFDLDDWEMRENPKYYFGIFPSSKALFFTQHLARKSIACIAASRFLEKFLSRYNRNTYYLPTGVDTDLFKPTPLVKKDGKIRIAWIGTFHKNEYIDNIKFFMECFRQIRKKHQHVYFEITGAGIYNKALEAIIRDFADRNVQLKGWIDSEGIPQYLAGIDIGILPVAYNGKFNSAKSPTKLFEYMAMAKATVSSAIGETIHIVNDGNNGFLAKDANEFVEKLEILINNESLRQKMGEQAREAVLKDYSLDILGRRLCQILKTI